MNTVEFIRYLKANNCHVTWDNGVYHPGQDNHGHITSETGALLERVHCEYNPQANMNGSPFYIYTIDSSETGQGLVFFVLILALLACALIILSIIINPNCIDAIASFWALIQNLIRSI